MNDYHLRNADGSAEGFVNHGDGTGTRTFYAADGTVASTEAVTGLDPVEPAPPSLDEQVAELQATVAALLAIIEGA